MRYSAVRSNNGRPLLPNRETAPRVLVGVAGTDRRTRLAKVLVRSGCDVRQAHTGFHVLEQLADAVFDATVARPDALVLDAVLPGCTGLSVVTGLRDLGWTTPVVLLAVNPARLRRQARALGAVVLERRSPPTRIAFAVDCLVRRDQPRPRRPASALPAPGRVLERPWSALSRARRG